MSDQFRTTASGGHKLIPDSVELYDHLVTALEWARRGERVVVRQGDAPWYTLVVRRLDGQPHITWYAGNQLIAPEHTPDAPDWMTNARAMLQRLLESLDVKQVS